MEHLVEALLYKPEGRGFNSRMVYWDFSLTYSFLPHFRPGVDPASNRSEYQEYLLGLKTAGAKDWLPCTFMCQFCTSSGSLKLLEH